MLKMIIIPLVIACLVTGVGALEVKTSGSIGIATLVYIIVTQVIGVMIGIILAVSIRPGTDLGDEPQFGTASSTEYGDTFADMLRNLVPENVVQACLQHVETEVSSNKSRENTGSTKNLTVPTKSVVYKEGTNLLGIIVFSLVFGWGVHAAGEVGKPVYNFFVGVSGVIFKMLTLIFCAAAMPFLFKCCEEECKIDNRVTKFVLPIAVTINRDGSVMFIMIAAMFIAQTYGMTIGAGEVAIAGLLIILLSLSLAAIPSGSLVLLVIVCSAMGIPISDETIGLLFTVDWLLDRVRSASNILSHGFACAVVERVCRKQLETSSDQPSASTQDHENCYDNAV
ncbi:excitatory amino acid transporter 3 [Lingula anatina]|uniref:Amino acid transporter n=1 Tax=Lingula anatina TaxID=7574 RepID=A0A2R2MS78_LINAN|nr:excitatory amino acid transporter 3 [Lingula anatina]|eukprot:XP_023933109.1 excitatory amino acid transporter 3 [Lingula anatina]